MGNPAGTGPVDPGASGLALQAPGVSEPVSAVLFDFGGVLAEEGFRNGLVALARLQGLDETELPRQGMDAVYDSGFVLGQGSAADFWSLLRRRTGLAGDDRDLTERILSGFVLRPRMLALTRRLRAAGFITGILSDQTHWLEDLDRRSPFLADFDRVYNSYYLGKGKRDPTLFRDVAADLGLEPSRVLFIDDNAGNCERARCAGMRALIYRSQAELEAWLNEQAGRHWSAFPGPAR